LVCGSCSTRSWHGHAHLIVESNFWFLTAEISSSWHVIAWIGHFLTYLRSWCIYTMLAFNCCSEFLCCWLKLFLRRRTCMTMILTSNFQTRRNSGLVFDLYVYWLFCICLRLYGILRKSSIHRIIHHSARFVRCHLRSAEWIAASPLLLDIILLLVSVFKCLVCDYVSAYYTQGAWILTLSLLLLLIEKSIVWRIVHLTLVAFHWTCRSHIWSHV